MLFAVSGAVQGYCPERKKCCGRSIPLNGFERKSSAVLFAVSGAVQGYCPERKCYGRSIPLNGFERKSSAVLFAVSGAVQGYCPERKCYGRSIPLNGFERKSLTVLFAVSGAVQRYCPERKKCCGRFYSNYKVFVLVKKLYIYNRLDVNSVRTVVFFYQYALFTDIADKTALIIGNKKFRFSACGRK